MDSVAVPELWPVRSVQLATLQLERVKEIDKNDIAFKAIDCRRATLTQNSLALLSPRLATQAALTLSVSTVTFDSKKYLNTEFTRLLILRPPP